MSKPAKAILNLMTILDEQQLNNVINLLGIEEINALYAAVLPIENDVRTRRVLREKLAKRANDIYLGNEKHKVIDEAIEKNQSIDEDLNQVYRKMALEILTQIQNEEAWPLFVQNLNDDELFVIQQSLHGDSLTLKGKKILETIQQEINSRKLDAEANKQLEEYRTNWRETKGGILWQSSAWQQINEKVRSANLQIQSQRIEEQPASQKEKFSLFAWLKKAWNAFVNLFRNPAKVRGGVKEAEAVEQETYRAIFSEEDDDIFEKMRTKGAHRVAAVSGKTGLGDITARSENIRHYAIQGRFGYILASQMIAGTQSNKHGELRTIADSIISSDDTDSTANSIYKAISGALSDPSENILKKTHVFATGGDDSLLSAFESQDLKAILSDDVNLSEHGLSFTEEEKAQIQQYQTNVLRSKTLNNAISTFANLPSRYKYDVEQRVYIKIEDGFEERQKVFEKELGVLSKAVLNGCADLEDGQALYLDTGLEYHAMKLSIKRVGDSYEMTAYDSSGGLENSSLSKRLFGLLKLRFMGYDAKRSNALSFTVSKDRLISPQGLDYFSNLIRLHSFDGWAEVSIEHNIRSTTREQRNRMGWIGRLLALSQASIKYINYINKFTAIAEPASPATFSKLLQRPQNTDNCFAKRLQANQLYELGKPTYKKLRLAVLLEEKKRLTEDLFGRKGKTKLEDEHPLVATEYVSALGKIEPMLLTPAELHDISMRLSEINTTPSTEYYKEYFTNLLKAKIELEKSPNTTNMLAAQRISQKISNYAKLYYEYLKKGDRTSEINEIFSQEFLDSQDTYDWNEGNIPLKMDMDGNIDEAVLTKFSEFATFKAWEASIQMLNHQIKKISVNERHIHSASQRLSHANYRSASRAVTLNDLKNANLVTFTTGYGRKEDIKIEISINGEKREIDKATFFKLVANNQDALTDPSVISLLSSLRTFSSKVEKRFINQVYPLLRDAFERKLESRIKGTYINLKQSADRLYQHLLDVNQLISKCQKELESVQSKPGDLEKGSTEYNNLDARRELITKELQRLESLKLSIDTKLNSLSQHLDSDNQPIQGAPLNVLANAQDILHKMKSNDPGFQTIREVTNAFVREQSKIQELEKITEKFLDEVEISDIENGIQGKTGDIDYYENKVINNVLQTNAEFRILNALALGRIGSDTNRNRYLYSNSTEERQKLEQEGRYTFVKGSVFEKIQTLNRKLKFQAFETVKRKVSLKTNIQEITGSSSTDTLLTKEEKLQGLEDYAEVIGKEPISENIKNEWVRQMFAIWLQHTDQELLYDIQQKDVTTQQALINQHFTKFIEQKTNIKFAALKHAGYPIELNMEGMQSIGWKTISESEIAQIRSRKINAANLIGSKFKQIQEKLSQKYKSEIKSVSIVNIHLKPDDIIAKHETSIDDTLFKEPLIMFLSQEERDAIDAGILKFLRQNKLPVCAGESEEECQQYFEDVANYLDKLKKYSGLENKNERIMSFCLSATTILFELPYPPPKTLIDELRETIIAKYRDEAETITDSFLKLENTQRNQILSSILKLTLSEIPARHDSTNKVNDEFFSIMKQWQRLINPPDESLNKRISTLLPGGTAPKDMSLLKELDTAIQESPIGLEGIYEGQKGLQAALLTLGDEDGIDANLRKLSDKLHIGVGEELLSHQFITFYSNLENLLPKDDIYKYGINSTQGREFFSRAFLNAYFHGTPEERKEISGLILSLYDELEDEVCTLKTPHQVFLDELIIQCSILSKQKEFDNLPLSIDVGEIQAFIHSLTDKDSLDASDRLFGFAKEINLLSRQIELNLFAEDVDQAGLDLLYSKLICANLAYQLMVSQASEEEMSNLRSNFEFNREMERAQASIYKLENNLVQFASHLGVGKRQEAFHKAFAEFNQSGKFDGPKIKITSLSSSDIPGFINFGGNVSLDVLHGAVYLGNNKLGIMPAHIQSHIALQELGINNLPFKPRGGGYVYVEENEVKISITPLEKGEIVLQRALTTLSGQSEMLQYIAPENQGFLPTSLQKRINAEHFFIDSEGAIHAYTSDFTPILKISKQDDVWKGMVVNHNGDKTDIEFSTTPDLSPMFESLIRAFPLDEMVMVNDNTVYIPAIKQFVVLDDTRDDFYISDSLDSKALRKQLKFNDNGTVFIENILTSSESEKVKQFRTQVLELESKLKTIKGGGVIARQSKENIQREIGELKSQITQISAPEYIVFTSEPTYVLELEKEYEQLREQVQKTYLESLQSGAASGKEAVSYELVKQQFIQSKQALKISSSSANHLNRYAVDSEGNLRPKDFQSVLSIGSLPDKTNVFIKLLGRFIPKEPLNSFDLDGLVNVKNQLRKIIPISQDGRKAIALIIGLEIQHHMLAREACVTGKRTTWDRVELERLKKEFSKEVKLLNSQSENFSVQEFSEVWRLIQSEFDTDTELKGILTEEINVVETGGKKPISIKDKTNLMPIEMMGAYSLVQYKPHGDLKSLVDKEQMDLGKRLKGLGEFQEAIQSQEDGYYYENFGLLDKQTVARLFRVSVGSKGICGLTKNHIDNIFNMMVSELGWIKPIEGMDKYQLSGHPRGFYSSPKVASYLSGRGFSRFDIKTITERLEVFLYQTAVCGGSYSITEGKQEELLEHIDEAREKNNISYLLARDKIESLLERASKKISFDELNAAYLLNDYSRILAYFPEEERGQLEIAFNNGMTLMLYSKTELDHLNNIQHMLNIGKVNKALSLLHVRRNYQLDKLLDSGIEPEKLKSGEALEVQQERRMQRAFLLFESEFGHRCNARQVEVFRGLLLDDEINPDKIDSAQARMGFGKTSLLPLVALYKTGDIVTQEIGEEGEIEYTSSKRLVRFIVPKSALETNTSDMSISLEHLLGARAVKDDFHRYRIEADPETNMGKDSPRLKSLQDAKADLQKRLNLYKRVRDNHEVLVQAPYVRNAIQCQGQIFLAMLSQIHEPDQEKELMECISLINEIRSLRTISIFDELDATQDPNATDVNYTSGKKDPFDVKEIAPLELIIETINQSDDKSVDGLASKLLDVFGITDSDGNIKKYITSLEESKPDSTENTTEILLIRAILTDPGILSLFTEKEASTDFGVWFENSSKGERLYDYNSLNVGGSVTSNQPLLIAVPYLAANTPKPQGSRFDNPEVTAISTFLYYMDTRTKLEEVPHLEFLIDAVRKGTADAAILDSKAEIPEVFKALFDDLQEIAQIEDRILRNEARETYFKTYIGSEASSKKIPRSTFRKFLSRVIIHDQIKFAPGKANSNRYEQGTVKDEVIGFSGTAGDTSSYFHVNRLDPAADGNMTLGIMGRKECQATITIDTKETSKSGKNYTTLLVENLFKSFSDNTRALLDVGGLCKASNLEVARILARELVKEDSPIKDNKGVIFYDDATNTKKVLVLDKDQNETILDLTPEMIKESDRNGSYFTYYDQSHTRGADIKQMDGAHAVLTLSFTVTNNDYKQAIMRLRKIIDKSSGQSFSTAVPENVRQKIINDLDLDTDYELTGNDIAFWLRKNELLEDTNQVSLMMKELDAVIKNAALQQQAVLTQVMSDLSMDFDAERIQIFRDCIKGLDKITPLITGSSSDLVAKYGNVYGTFEKRKFLDKLQNEFDKKLTTIFSVINTARSEMDIPRTSDMDKEPYMVMRERIFKKREPFLSEEFVMLSSTSSLSEVHSESESQSESQSQSQSQSQAQTHAFSQVTAEEVVVEAKLRKRVVVGEPLTLDFISSEENIASLPMPHQIETMNNLFNDKDPIKCSPSYSEEVRKAISSERSVPPVRYLLVRNEGNPKVIMINQDEANLFKKQGGSPWSLYDITLKKSDSFKPIVGPSVPALEGLLLKKLLFVSYGYQVAGKTIGDLALSFEGICTRSQLEPTLSIQYDVEEVSSHDYGAIFSLPSWGFYGDKNQEIAMFIEQTHKVFNERFENNGVTIKLGREPNQGEVFISSKLNERILNASVEKEQGKIAVDKPFLEQVKEDVKREFEEAKQELREIKRDINHLKEEKIRVINDSDNIIRELEERKAKAINNAKKSLESDYELNIKGYLDARNPLSALQAQNIAYYCRRHPFVERKDGIIINGKHYATLGDAVGDLRDKFLVQENRDHSLSDRDIELNINLIVANLTNVALARYKESTFYHKKSDTFVEEFIKQVGPKPKQLNRVGAKSKRRFRGRQYINIENLRIWGDKFDHVFHEHFNLFFSSEEQYETLKRCFQDALNDHLSPGNKKDFETSVIERIGNIEDKSDNTVNFVFDFITTLSYSLNVGGPIQHEKAIREELELYIKHIIRQSISEPTDEQEALFTKVNEILKGMDSKFEYSLPDRLIDVSYDTDSIEDIKIAVKEALKKQNVRASEHQIDELSRDCQGFLARRKAVNQLLENYQPVSNRSDTLRDKSGKEHKLTQGTHKVLTELDDNVSAIQRQIDEAKMKKAAQLEEISLKQAKLKEKRQVTQGKVKKLKGEWRAINQLWAGIRSIRDVFRGNQVSLEKESPATFFENHFNLRLMIENKVDTSATLLFSSPEVYDVEEDMNEQIEHMHGLSESESSAKRSLGSAMDVVIREADKVKPRPHKLNGVVKEVNIILEDVSTSVETEEHHRTGTPSLRDERCTFYKPASEHEPTKEAPISETENVEHQKAQKRSSRLDKSSIKHL